MNLMAIVLVPLCMMLIVTFLNAQVILLLEDPDEFNVDPAKVGEVAGQLISYSLPPAVISTFFVGYLYDILGRRLTLFFSFTITSILMIFIPHMAPVIFPNLMCLRAAISVTIVPPIACPLVGDYLAKDTIGKGAALVGIGFIVGEILSMGVLFTVTKHMEPNAKFLTVAVVGIFLASFFLVIVKEPLLRKKEKDISSEDAAEQNIRRLSTVNRPEISQIPAEEDTAASQ